MTVKRIVFLFRNKTAYEMRIRDWSSDVCSSDLLPLPTLPGKGLARTVGGDFTFWFRSNSAMDTNSAIADVRDGKARIWSGLKSPIVAQQAIARELGLKDSDVEVNVVQSGGSFGRRLFYDAALEAAKISKAMGVDRKSVV